MTMILPTINLVARPNMVLPSDTWTFTRAGTAGCTNPTGFLGLYPTDSIRHEYELNTPNTGAYNGILIETESTNAVYQTRRAAYSWTQSISGSAIVSASGEGMTDKADATGPNTCAKVIMPSGGVLTLTAQPAQMSFQTVPAAPAAGKYTISAYIRVASAGKSVTTVFSLGTETSTVNKVVSYDAGRDWTRVYSIFDLGAKPTTASMKITADAGTVFYIDYVQVESGNLTSPMSSAAKRPSESLVTKQTAEMGVKINNYEGTLFAMFKQSDNEANIKNSVYPIIAIAGTASAVGLYRVTSDGTNGTTVKNAIMAKSAVGTMSNEYAAQVTKSSTGWFKVALSFGANTARPVLAVNGTIYTDLPGSLGAQYLEAPSSTSIPVLRVGHAPAMTAFSVTDPSDTNITYSQSATTTPLALDGTIMHAAYFPRVLSDTDLAAITS